ncbi:hypothetical protein P153DRAFT_100622 [Dothidotthia symphoricarpi CBS 119687]|uniref:Uncharacterized protein n=1 Tax=Dothidotthia symphoricarpi CBS 119687 TaxID=1392245 RepID=A0A6A6APH3_9PLEO|nr:uncharacterized protein P153DRAFT_100622 [Dothidotthia symphoricarpi CBS 119687]KAF2133892.1 hypothetical protein P153DRAFT_100622 [Dothidotthia symphoricarpi CBS 119687]
MALMQVCRQIRSEFKPMFMGRWRRETVKICATELSEYIETFYDEQEKLQGCPGYIDFYLDEESHASDVQSFWEFDFTSALQMICRNPEFKLNPCKIGYDWIGSQTCYAMKAFMEFCKADTRDCLVNGSVKTVTIDWSGRLIYDFPLIKVEMLQEDLSRLQNEFATFLLNHEEHRTSVSPETLLLIAVPT